jgi:hypothetical protein
VSSQPAGPGLFPSPPEFTKIHHPHPPDLRIRSVPRIDKTRTSGN